MASMCDLAIRAHDFISHKIDRILTRWRQWVTWLYVHMILSLTKLIASLLDDFQFAFFQQKEIGYH